MAGAQPTWPGLPVLPGYQYLLTRMRSAARVREHERLDTRNGLVASAPGILQGVHRAWFGESGDEMIRDLTTLVADVEQALWCCDIVMEGLRGDQVPTDKRIMYDMVANAHESMGKDLREAVGDMCEALGRIQTTTYRARPQVADQIADLIRRMTRVGHPQELDRTAAGESSAPSRSKRKA
jgi:hypothetical protein